MLKPGEMAEWGDLRDRRPARQSTHEAKGQNVEARRDGRMGRPQGQSGRRCALYDHAIIRADELPDSDNSILKLLIINSKYET